MGDVRGLVHLAGYSIIDVDLSRIASPERPDGSADRFPCWEVGALVRITEGNPRAETLGWIESFDAQFNSGGSWELSHAAIGALEHVLICAVIRAERLVRERDALAAAVQKHHAQKADDRCVLDDDELYAAAGLPSVDRRVGDKAAMLENCARFIDRRCEAGGWPTYAELEDELTLWRWLTEMRLTVQENAVVGVPPWTVLDVDGDMIGRGDSPIEAIRNARSAIDEVHAQIEARR